MAWITQILNQVQNDRTGNMPGWLNVESKNFEYVKVNYTMLEKLRQKLKGKVKTSQKTRDEYSHDASLFEVEPDAVVFPKNADDVTHLVDWVNDHKDSKPGLSLTARSGGTDMTGGSINDSIIVSFTEHMNNFSVDGENQSAWVQPGVYYRDFEPATLNEGLILPSYPASRSIAALGGMIANNAGGEKTIRHGKTEDYVQALKVVLADGNQYTLEPLNRDQLEAKMNQDDFEGQIYRKTFDLIEENYDLIKQAEPDVSKNSAGYKLWHVWDRESGIFDLSQLFVGSQGTLGIITDIKLKLIDPEDHKKLLVLFLKDLEKVPEIINKLLPLEPEALEAFDDATLKLALRFFPGIAKKIPDENLISLLWKFLPEAWMTIKLGRFPKMVMLVQFAEEEEALAKQKVQKAFDLLEPYNFQERVVPSEQAAEKYWVIRRESFNLLRSHVKGKRAAPFIDDFIVKPEHLPEVLPKISEILQKHDLPENYAGHAADGNFHIFPLMDLSDQAERDKITKVSEEIYDVVLEYEGSITAEHNDGMIRGPYLEKMYGEEIFDLFKQVKAIFDPDNIFNPHKKADAEWEFSEKHIRTDF